MTRLQPLFPLGSALGRQGLFEIPRRQRRGPQLIEDQELKPEEERSLLGKVMGGVQYAAQALDKPGSAVRGLAAGRPGQLANLVPFSGTFGLTDVAERTSGRDLLEQYGVAAPNIPGLFNSPGDFAGDVGGFMLEVAMDPLTWFAGPLGAISKTGKAATAAKAAKEAATAVGGVKGAAKAFEITTGAAGDALRTLTPSTWADEIRAGERAWAAFHAPWPLNKIIPGQIMLGTGKRFGDVADVVSGALFRNPVSLATRSLLSAPMKGALQGALQIVRDRAHAENKLLQAAFRDSTEAIRAVERPIYEQFCKLAAHADAAGDADSAGWYNQVGRDWGEKLGKYKPDQMAEVLARHTKLTPDTIRSVVDVDLMAGQFDDMLTGMADMRNRLYDEGWRLGLLRGDRGDAGKLVDIFIGHVPRRLTEGLRKAAWAKEKFASQATENLFEFSIGRDEMLRHFPGGAAELNRVAMDSLANGTVAAGVKTVPEEAAKSLAPGVVVRAADRNNFGKVLQVSKDGKTASVFFRNPETFQAAVVDLPAEKLKVQYYGAPEELLNRAHYLPVDEATWRGQLAKRLDELGFETTVATGKLDKAGQPISRPQTFKELHLNYISYLHHQALKLENWETASEMSQRLGTTLDETQLALTKRTIDGEQLTKQQFIDRFNTKPVISKISSAGKAAESTELSSAERMSRFLQMNGLDVAHGGLFDRRLAMDHADYMMSISEHIGTLRATHKYLDDVLTKGKGIRLAKPGEGEDMVSLADAWDDAGFGRQGLVTFVRSRMPKAAVKDGVALNDAEILSQVVPELLIDAKASRPLKALNEVTQPVVRRALLEMSDRVMAAYKGMLTASGGPLWGVPFHVRNVGGGFFNSWIQGKVSVWELMAGYNSAARQARLNAQVAKGATVAVKPMQFLEEFVENGGLKGQGRMIDILGEQAAAQIAEQLPRGPVGGFFAPLGPRNVGKAFRERGIQAANPLHTRGVVQHPASILGQSGEAGYNFVEYLNRAGYYEALRKHGYSISESLEAVKQSQFDLSELSGFEKGYARRAIPFYGWARKNIPYQFSKLFEAPGGRQAQTIRAVSQRDDQQYTPSFLREGLGIRVGGTEREATFLKQSGIPIEDLNKFVFSRGLPSSRSLEKMAAQLHPLIAMPMEKFADKQFYTGRSMKNLDSVTGSRTADSLLHYSPFSRVAGEIAGLIDKRKPLGLKLSNALTGVKFATYDAKKHRLIDLSRALEKELETSPYVRKGEYFYIPEDEKAAAAAEQDKIRRIAGLNKEIKLLREEESTP